MQPLTNYIESNISFMFITWDIFRNKYINSFLTSKLTGWIHQSNFEEDYVFFHIVTWLQNDFQYVFNRSGCSGGMIMAGCWGHGFNGGGSWLPLQENGDGKILVMFFVCLFFTNLKTWINAKCFILHYFSRNNFTVALQFPISPSFSYKKSFHGFFCKINENRLWFF